MKFAVGLPHIAPAPWLGCPCHLLFSPRPRPFQEALDTKSSVPRLSLAWLLPGSPEAVLFPKRWEAVGVLGPAWTGQGWRAGRLSQVTPQWTSLCCSYGVSGNSDLGGWLQDRGRGSHFLLRKWVGGLSIQLCQLFAQQRSALR